MNPLENLHDIDGLKEISFWPLSLGAYVTIALLTLSICALFYLFFKRMKFKRSWKGDALKKLALLEKNLNEATQKTTVIALSEYIRRIAVKRFPRKKCAGLVGTYWLKWLTENDPNEFDWTQQGKILVQAPYSDPNCSFIDCSQDQIKTIINATRNWVK